MRLPGKTLSTQVVTSMPIPKHKKMNYFLRHWQLYSMIAPGLLFFVIFKYIPLFGSVIAFQNFNVFFGVFESPWVGLQHFVDLFTFPDLIQILRNTLIISFYQLVFGFPAPIILALLLNEVRKMAFKRTIQTVVYLPHFLSWVIVGGLVLNFLSPHSGLLNSVLQELGGKPIYFMMDPKYFRTIVVTSGIWKDVGWGTIIYLAAMASIDKQLYEAAQVDGAGRFRQAMNITVPALLPTIMVLLLLQISGILDLGFEQIYILLNPMVTNVGDVFDTFIYRVGLVGGQFSYTTAIGLFKSIVSFILIVGANKLSKKLTGSSIY